MRKLILIAATALLVVAGSGAWAHPATERYIPIGKSPGVSGKKSYVGEIRSISDHENGFSMTVENANLRIEVDQYTKIYLDTGKGRVNSAGARSDCRVGRLVEVYVHESGTAYWVKIRSR